jgi:hypothetical protein
MALTNDELLVIPIWTFDNDNPMNFTELYLDKTPQSNCNLNKYLLTYVWLDSENGFRSKTRTMRFSPGDLVQEIIQD